MDKGVTGANDKVRLDVQLEMGVFVNVVVGRDCVLVFTQIWTLVMEEILWLKICSWGLKFTFCLKHVAVSTL